LRNTGNEKRYGYTERECNGNCVIKLETKTADQKFDILVFMTIAAGTVALSIIYEGTSAELRGPPLVNIDF